jgi:hypothetical protein
MGVAFEYGAVSEWEPKRNSELSVEGVDEERLFPIVGGGHR